MIAALFVDAKGCYAGLPGVDAWGIDRDARNYAGPWPVVAHPPCQLWGRFAHVNFARWGGEHNRPHNDGGKFASALASVRAWGGAAKGFGEKARRDALCSPVIVRRLVAEFGIRMASRLLGGAPFSRNTLNRYYT